MPDTGLVFATGINRRLVVSKVSRSQLLGDRVAGAI
jgi:hypothetical protein